MNYRVLLTTPVRFACWFVLPIVVCIVAPPAWAQQFEMQVIDPDHAGDCKAAGDIDNDGYPDLAVGGMPNEPMTWYRYPDWKKTVIGKSSIEFSTDCSLGDVDGDGDLDMVVPDGDKGTNLLWFENVTNEKGRDLSAGWPRHEVGEIGGWGKDVELADFDHDGRLDIAVRSLTVKIFFQTARNVWTATTFTDLPLGVEGMGSGDVDGDKNVDLVVLGAWLRNPGGSAIRDAKAWRLYTIGDAPETFKTEVTDIDGDGVNDILFSSSEGTADVAWWSPETGDATGKWTKHVIVPMMERVHTLQAADMDGDGDMDVVFGQMHTTDTKLLAIAENLDGKGKEWRRIVVDRTGLHDGVVVDVGNDGLLDIFGANWTGNPPVRLWRRKGPGKKQTLSNEFWTPLIVTRQHRTTFGLSFADMDGDGRDDIVSGNFVYLNPGKDLSGQWPQHSLAAGMEAFATLDVDEDGAPDIIAQHQTDSELELYWLKSKTRNLDEWAAVKIGAVPKASHELGAQGYRIADLVSGGKPEIAIASGGGIYFFEIPKHPATEKWARTHVSGNPFDEGFAAGDIDGDGLLDIAASTGESKHVEWYKNPGEAKGPWTAHRLGEMQESVFPDRLEVADLNGDGRLDVIVSEENGNPNGAKTYWWENPKSLDGEPAWPRHLLTTQATTHGLDAADTDKDGDVDLVTGEHRGSRRTTLWLNDGQGNFQPTSIAHGYESHLGSRFHDLDGDGDLDIVSIAWDDSGLIWVARNDAITRAPLTNSKAPAAASPPPAGFLDRLRAYVRRLVN